MVPWAHTSIVVLLKEKCKGEKSKDEAGKVILEEAKEDLVHHA